MNSRSLYFPLKISMWYLFITYGLFFFGGISAGVDNIYLLTIYVVVVYFSLYCGYRFGITLGWKGKVLECFSQRRISRVKLLIGVGALYMAVWGINQIFDFGGRGIGDVFQAIINPGNAYASKFDVYDARVAEGQLNRVTQILILSSAVFSMALPVFFAYKDSIGLALRYFFYFCVFVYVLSFMFIGTQKGLGDVVILGVAGWLVSWMRSAKFNFRIDSKIVVYLSVIFISVFLYMVFNQMSRVETFGLTTTLMTENIDFSSSWIALLFGKDFAVGYYLILGYPTHGYIGLAHNLDQEYFFSFGAGFSQAFESYRFQYFGGDNNLLLTYPYRTEVATGWPAGMYWATALPWLASDLTFLGVVPFVFFIGVLFARTWISCLKNMDFLSLAILGQIFIFVVFLPANNQVLQSRQGLVTVVTLVFIKIFVKFVSRFHGLRR